MATNGFCLTLGTRCSGGDGSSTLKIRLVVGEVPGHFQSTAEVALSKIPKSQNAQSAWPIKGSLLTLTHCPLMIACVPLCCAKTSVKTVISLSGANKVSPWIQKHNENIPDTGFKDIVLLLSITIGNDG